MKSVSSMILIVVISLSTDICLASVSDEVRCREINFSQSAENRDATAFATFIDADARFVGNSVAHGIDEILEAWAGLLSDDGPAIKWRPQFVEVLEDGTLALTRGPYLVITKDEDGNVLERWGTFNSVWRLGDDGEWRVVFDAGSPAAAAPSDAQKAILNSSCATPQV